MPLKYEVGKKPARWIENWLNHQARGVVVISSKSSWGSAINDIPMEFI